MLSVPATAVSDHAGRVIRQRIAQGMYPVGSLLPSQRELSQQVGYQPHVFARGVVYLARYGFGGGASG